MTVTLYIYDDIANPWLGGGGAYGTCAVAEEFSRCGHDVRVRFAAYPGASRDQSRNGVKYERLGIGLNHTLSRLTYVIAGNFLCAMDRSDLIILENSPFSPIVPICHRPRVITSVRNYFGHQLVRSRGWVGWLFYWSEKLCLRRAAHIVTVSHDMKEKLLPDSAGKRVSVCYNGIPEEMFTSRQKRKYLLFVGRLDDRQKNITFLIDVWRSLAELRPDYRLLIVGDGRDRQTVEAYIRKHAVKRIRLIGRIEQSRLAGVYAAAQLALMPSAFESFGRALLEAQAAGAPVIASDLPVFAEVCGEQSAIRLVLDPQLWVQTISELLEAPSRLANLASSGRQNAERFAQPEMIAERVRVYLGQTEQPSAAVDAEAQGG
jgi:glycosyltransferase involved in cell wall biosynthesis